MKRAITVILAVTMLLSLLACGIPAGMDEETYNAGKDALEVMQNYNKGLMSDDAAYKRIDVLYKRLDNLKFNDFDKDQKNTRVLLCLLEFKIAINGKGDTFKCADDLKTMLGQ